jgi:hypothetical protein
MRPLRLTDDRGDDCASHRIVRIVASFASRTFASFASFARIVARDSTDAANVPP